MKKTFRVVLTQRSVYRFECDVEPGDPAEEIAQAENQFSCLSPEARAKLEVNSDETFWEARATPEDQDSNTRRRVLKRQVEYLLANEDRTWDTVVVDVPDHVRTDRESLVQWAEDNLGRLVKYRKVVLFALYARLGESEELIDSDEEEK